MKNYFLAFVMLTTMFLGCKPRTQELTPYQSIDSKLIELAKVSFKQNQSLALSKSVNPVIQETDNRLNYWGYTSFRMFFPVWESSELINLSNGNKVLITPLRRNLNVDYGNLYYIRRLRIEFDAQENLVNVNIVELITLKNTVASQKYQILAHIFEEIPTRTDAKIIIYDAGYTPLSQNTSWKGEITNNNTNNRGSSDGTDSPLPTCYYLTAVASCSDVQYLADISVTCEPGDEPNSIYGVGNIINNCPGGSSGGGYTPPSGSNPPPGSSGGTGDIGQDDPYIFGTFDYNGVNIDSYYLKNNVILAIDERTIETVQEIIDDPDFRSIISAYLGTGDQNKIHIVWKEEGWFKDLVPSKKNGYFNSATNVLYLNPDLIIRHGRIGIVKTMVHEGFHAMYAKPNAQQLQEYNSMKNWLNTNDGEHIGHNCMSFYKVDIAVRIMKRFDRGAYGSNDPKVKDEHLKGFFITSTLGDLNPTTGKPLLQNKAWDILSPSDKRMYRLKTNELIKIYQQVP